MLASEGTIAFSGPAEIEGMFEKAIQAYHSQGIVATKPELQRVEPLADDLAAVDVRWPGLDKAGVEKSSERSHYIVQLSRDGQPRIRVALTRKKG